MLVLLAVVTIVVSPAVRAQTGTPVGTDAVQTDWPMYRGNTARTGVAVGSGPLDSPSVVWQVATQGQIHSEPAIVAGVAYIGSGDNMLHAFDAKTGTELWHALTGGA